MNRREFLTGPENKTGCENALLCTYPVWCPECDCVVTHTIFHHFKVGRMFYCPNCKAVFRKLANGRNWMIQFPEPRPEPKPYNKFIVEYHNGWWKIWDGDGHKYEISATGPDAYYFVGEQAWVCLKIIVSRNKKSGGIEVVEKFPFCVIRSLSTRTFKRLIRSNTNYVFYRRDSTSSTVIMPHSNNSA